jgi:hypothetical protein
MIKDTADSCSSFKSDPNHEQVRAEYMCLLLVHGKESKKNSVTRPRKEKLETFNIWLVDG